MESEARGYNWANLFLGDINKGTWSSRLLSLNETLIYGYGSCESLTSERLRCKLQTRPLVREVALHEETRTCRTKENFGDPTPRITGRLTAGCKINRRS
jgi:hypothetical protein